MLIIQQFQLFLHDTYRQCHNLFDHLQYYYNHQYDYTHKDPYRLTQPGIDPNIGGSTNLFFTNVELRAGFEFNSIDLDLSYLFSTGSVRSPLENTLRFGLTFTFGEEYDEY